jgi:hypothetical protein
MFVRVLLPIYALMIASFYGIVLTSNVLAFLGLYQAPLVIGGALLVTFISFTLYWQMGRTWREALVARDDNALSSWLSGALLVSMLVFFIVIFGYRLALYPQSPIGDVVSADLVGYHGVKAYSLVSSGTLWKLDLIYGQYPIGYESFLSLGIVLGVGVEIAGLMQAFTIFFLALTLFFLLRRYTTLPSWLLLLLVMSSFFYPDFYGFLLLVGKNDLLLATTILAAILHAPLGWQSDDHAFHPIGLALVTMISLATKASGLFILFALWGIVLWRWGRAWQSNRWQGAWQFMSPWMFLLTLVLMFSGGLWVIRNYLMMGALFSPEISGFFIGSVINNINNPDLFNSGSESAAFIRLMLLQIVMLVLLVWRKQWHAIILLVMLFAFITAPLGAFHRPERDTLHIEWRYTAHSFMYIAVLVVAGLAMLERRFNITSAPFMSRLAPIAYVLFILGVIVFLDANRINQHRPDNARILRNIPAETLPTGEYASVYDYVQREIRHATIGYAWAEPLFLYDVQATNDVYAGPKYPLGLPSAQTERIPDYLVHTWRRTQDSPFKWQPYFEQFTWREVYQDETGVVWERVP